MIFKFVHLSLFDFTILYLLNIPKLYPFLYKLILLDNGLRLRTHSHHIEPD